MIRNRQGIAVVFSLLIISLVTLIGLGITHVITRELSLSGNIDHAVSAFYAAEGGVEKGLYRVKTGKLANESVSTVLAAIQGYTASFSSNSSTYTNEASELSGTTAQDLAENQTVQVDYSATNAPCANGACVESWVVEWGGGLATTIEATFISWSPGAQIILDSETTKLLFELPANSSPVTINTPQFNKYYRLRVKALGGDLQNLSITAYDSDDPLVSGGVIVPSATVITVKGVGQKGDFSQSLTAIVPWQLQLSGIFDYVLFSEKEILKTVAVVTNPPIVKTGRVEIEANLGTARYCECGDPSGNGNIDQCPLSGPLRWWGTCDAGGNPSTIQVTKCNLTNPPEAVGTCSVDDANLGLNNTNYAGFYTPTNLLSLPSGQYYLRVSGTHFGAAANVYLDDPITSPGAAPTTETFRPPAATGGGACKFNCLFTTPIRVGFVCNGGANNGKACVLQSDCPGVSNGCTMYSGFYLLGDNSYPSGGGKPTYFDWYSLSSSALLTGPSDKYCSQLGANECLP